METLLAKCSSSFTPNSFKCIHRESISFRKFFCMVSTNGSSRFLTQKLTARRKSVVASAEKNKKKKEKEDAHSFVARPDEATGPFPEAVLLKKRVVMEDGRVLPEFADAEEEKLFEYLNLQLESDLNVERIRHYEVVYLIHEDHVDEVGSVISKVEDFIREKKGKIWRCNNWGLRRLAYKIQKARNANYILMNFELEAKWINDFKSMLDKDERVIRHLVIKRKKAITEDCPPPLEYHTLRSNVIEDDMGDEFDDDVQDMDDEGELDDVSYEDDNDIEDGIVFNDDDDENDNQENVRHGGSGGSSRGTKRILKVEKIARY